jgi:hypothetical protein
MKNAFVLGTICFVCVVGWKVADKLSTDALSMGIGVVFGVLAGVPTALMVLAASRRKEPAERPVQQYQPPQQPMIVMMGGPQGWEQPSQQSYIEQDPIPAPKLITKRNRQEDFQEW